jgi:hypothetical protein
MANCKKYEYDFIIKRNSTQPSVRLKIYDCDRSPIDLTGKEITVSMWADAKLKKDIDESEFEILLADNVGLNSVVPDDVILFKNSSNHELMQVSTIVDNSVMVTRGYFSTTPISWKKGSNIKIIKIMNSSATYDLVREDVIKLNGTVEQNVMVESYLVYNWFVDDTRVPGEYYLEFKVIEKNESDEIISSRKYPEEKEGIFINILDNNLETY